MKDEIIELLDPELADFLRNEADLDFEETLVLSTTNIIHLYGHTSFKNFINLTRINRLRRISRFFNKVNEKLEVGDVFVCCAETLVLRRKRIKALRIPGIRTFYQFVNFIFHRLFPKVWGFKTLYFAVTRGRRRQLSQAETLGRLYSCGFEVEKVKEINGLLYVVARKVGPPIKHKKPSYGALYKMPRVGKNGKIIEVYKFRTMHPYSEFIQDYLIKNHGYAKNGKINNDFRLTKWGKVMRKFWIDEIPQLINVMKFEMKLVGVRPVSKRYEQDLPEDYRLLRRKQKPGCIPPTIALNTKTNIEEAVNAEKIYIKLYSKNPIKTDVTFAFKAMFSIVFRGKRSA